MFRVYWVDMRQTDVSKVHPAVDIPLDYRCGPAMRKLNERQQAFVIAMLDFGGINNTEAARAAGYGDGPNVKATACRLAHDENILAAIDEEANKRLNSSKIMCTNMLLEIAANTPEVKDRLKAIEMVMNRTGMHATSEHKVAVTHKDETTDEQVKRLTSMAKVLGIDPQKLLGTLTIDAEFVEVAPEDELSDLY